MPVNTQVVSLNEEGQIKIAIYGYLIETELKPSRDTVLFVSASDSEYRAIKSKFPSCIFSLAERAEITKDRKVLDKVSKHPGIILEVKWIKIDGEKAKAHAGYFSGAGITFDFELRRIKMWGIEKVIGPTVADY